MGGNCLPERALDRKAQRPEEAFSVRAGITCIPQAILRNNTIVARIYMLF